MCAKSNTKEKNVEYDVVIIGSGPAGLCAAHELAEQNLRVLVLEANDFIGGKPISWEGHPFAAPKSGDDWTAFCQEPLKKIDPILPGEHAFRVYPDNYQNLIDIMKRIPRGPEEGPGNVTDNLINTLCIAKTKEQEQPEKNKTLWSRFLSTLEATLFGLGLYAPYLVCEERAVAYYDAISFGENVNYFKRSPEMRQYLDRISGTSASGNPRLMSALAVSNLLLNYYFAPNNSGLQTFYLPTQDAWLKPWQDYLEKIGVVFKTGCELTHFEYNVNHSAPTVAERDFTTSLASAVVKTTSGETARFSAHYYISAIPANNLADIMNQNLEMIRYDPKLVHMFQITTLPASGAQLFYEHPIKEIAQEGFGFYLCDHPWEVSMIEQTSLWKTPKKYAENRMVITIYIAIMNAPGPLFGKTMLECTAQEIAAEMFTAFENALRKHRPNVAIPNRVGFFTHQLSPLPKEKDQATTTLTEQHLTSKDPINDERLHLCVPGLYPLRPPSDRFYLNNLLLAGAWAKNHTYYVSTMESAAESGREAANTLLKKFNKKPISVYKEVQLPRWMHWSRRIDKFFYKFYLPNPLSLLLFCLRRFLDTRSVHIHPDVYNKVDFKHAKKRDFN